MDKKNLFILLAVISFCMAGMSGCSDENEEKKPQMSAAAVNNYEAKDTDITVTGEVTEITGNRVTLALGTLSDNSRSDRGKDDDRSGERPQMSDDERPQMPDGERPDPGSGGMPSGDFGEGILDFDKFDKGGFGEGGDPSMGGGKRGGASIEKNGDESTYIIPVGMPIDGLSGRNSDYSGISVGTVLTLTVNEDGILCAASAE